MMNYYSLSFILFLFFSLSAYYVAYLVIPKKQWCILLLANLAFYAFNDINGLVFIAVTSITTWYGAKYSQRLKHQTANFKNLSHTDIATYNQKQQLNNPQNPTFRKQLKEIILFK